MRENISEIKIVTIGDIEQHHADGEQHHADGEQHQEERREDRFRQGIPR